MAALRARGAVRPVVPWDDAALAYGSYSVALTVQGCPREDLRGWKGPARAVALEGRPFRYGVEVLWPKGSELERLPFPGERVVVDGRLRLPRRPKNPGDFDEAGFLADRGLAWVLQASSWRRDRPPGWAWAPKVWAERLRRSVHARLFALLIPDEARLSEGLLLGYKGALAPRLARAVRNAGLIHLIVPSGAKVALAVAAALALAGLLRLSAHARWLLAFSAGLAVTLAAGGDAPYWRACIAAAALLFWRARGREGDAFQALVLSAWAQLLFWPRALFSAGFQMTYLALAGLLSLWPVARRLAPARWPRWARALALGAGTSLIVQGCLWPVFAEDFGRGSVVGLAANVVAVPAYPFFAGAAWSLWAMSFVCARLAAALAVVLAWALSRGEAFCQAAASLPGAVATLAPWPPTSVAAYYLVLLAPSRRSWRGAAACLSLALACRALGALSPAPPLRVVYLKPPKLAGRPRQAALILAAGRAWVVGSAPPSLLRKALLSYDALGRVQGRSPAWSGRPLRLGSVSFRFDPPGVAVAGSESAIIKRALKFSAVEVATDGVEVHAKTPRSASDLLGRDLP
ncbi:MAG: ComEC/Rec2 family competence protein [Elusimicrobia bacterium]|nr:ComEC/Rec2 family competence protein [Elusimicrobiota bacterium]